MGYAKSSAQTHFRVTAGSIQTTRSDALESLLRLPTRHWSGLASPGRFRGARFHPHCRCAVRFVRLHELRRPGDHWPTILRLRLLRQRLHSVRDTRLWQRPLGEVSFLPDRFCRRQRSWKAACRQVTLRHRPACQVSGQSPSHYHRPDR